MLCKNCGNIIDSDKLFCGKCGAKVERPSACQNCGAELSEDTDFCGKCGCKVGNVQNQAASRQAAGKTQIQKKGSKRWIAIIACCAAAVAVFFILNAAGAVSVLSAGDDYLGISNEKVVLLAPSDKSVFDKYPRTTTLQWAQVKNAKQYEIEIAFSWENEDEFGQWDSSNSETRDPIYVSDNQYTFDFVGGQPGRWRVRAIYENGSTTDWSDWWYFKYLQ